MKPDCIFFEETYEEIPKYRHCKHTKGLFLKGKEDSEMCKNCRLWDAYIPESASKEERDKAIAWQNMSYADQPDYDEYFK